jgi:hypothetical protein
VERVAWVLSEVDVDAVEDVCCGLAGNATGVLVD